MATTINASNTALTFGNGGVYVVTGSNDFITFGSGVTVTLQGSNDSVNAVGGGGTITFQGLNAYAGLTGGTGYVVNNDVSSDSVNLTANTTATVNGAGGNIGLLGSNDAVFTSNETISTVGTTSGETVVGTGDVINGSASLSINVGGGADTVNLSSSNDYLGLLGGTGYVVTNAASSDTVSMQASTTVTVNGSGANIGLLGSNDAVFTNNETINTVGTTSGEAVYGTGDVVNGSANLSINVGGGADTINLASSNDSLGLLGGTGYVITNDVSSDTVNLQASTTATVFGTLGNVGLLGSNDAVFTNNETINTVANTVAEIVSGSGDIVNGSINLAINVSGGNDIVNLGTVGDMLGLTSGAGYLVTGDIGSDIVNLGTNTGAAITGAGGSIGLLGSGDAVVTDNETVNTVANTIAEMVIGTGDTVNGAANLGINVSGGADTINLASSNDSLGLLGGTGYVVTNDARSDTVNMLANTTATVNGMGGNVGLLGSNDAVFTSNETINTVGSTYDQAVYGTGDTVNGSANLSINVGGGADTVNLSSSNAYLGLLGGTGYVVNNDASSDTVNMLASTTVTVNGAGGNIGLLGNSDAVFTNNETIDTATGDQNELLVGTGDIVNGSTNMSISVGGGNDTINLAGGDDFVALISGTDYTVTNDATGDTVRLAPTTTANIGLAGGSVSPDDIDAAYNMVLDRDPSAAELSAAETSLAAGATLNGLIGQLAGSAELQADLASTDAAVGAVAPSLADQVAFADAMSGSYGGPITLYSVDPGFASIGQLAQAETVLADTSATNLLAELPVLETEANGVNLGLQLADGTQIQFADTSALASFLYAVAVQQMQATSFVTANYELDEQWLTTVGQPLLNLAVYLSEMAQADNTVGGANYAERAVEANTAAGLALKIAALAPAARQDLTVSIANPQTGNPTQVTVYANASGWKVHDVSPNVLGYVIGGLSTALSIAALVSGNAYLYSPPRRWRRRSRVRRSPTGRSCRGY